MLCSEPDNACRLGGELRPVAHAERRIAEAAKLGFGTVIVPAASAPSARGRLAGAHIVPCRTVVEALHAALGHAVFERSRSRGENDLRVVAPGDLDDMSKEMGLAQDEGEPVEDAEQVLA